MFLGIVADVALVVILMVVVRRAFMFASNTTVEGGFENEAKNEKG